jgi:hypothetical protein
MAVGDGGIKIVDKSKVTVTTVESTMAGIAAALQSALRGATFVNSDIIYSIEIVRNKNSNDVIAYIIWEDQ